MINLTANAKEHFATMLQENSNALGINIGLKQAGCTGLAYVLDLATTMPDNAKQYSIDSVNIIIANKDLKNLNNLTVDYVVDAMGGHIKFSNPNSNGECGCGESFSVK